MSAERVVLVVEAALCARLRGESIRDCACRLPQGGWAECPPSALGAARGELPRARAAAALAETGPGFTGDACDWCGNFRVIRNGTCLLCTDCGTTSGCS